MDSDKLRHRITDQFSYESERSDIWQLFNFFIATDAYLNLGYSKWYQPHMSGSSQRRLVTQIGNTIATYQPSTNDRRLLDVGCGRGGPAIQFANEFGFDVIGVDLVRYNIRHAKNNACSKPAKPQFLVGDATTIPICANSIQVCTAIDALVYLSDREQVFEELQNILASEGIFVFSDLVTRSNLPETNREAINEFAEYWDMPALGTVSSYKRALQSAGFDIRSVKDITHYSIGHFRKWTTIFLYLYASPAQRVIDSMFKQYGLNSEMILKQIQSAHAALPYLQHVIIVAQKTR
ncbi:MAG: class I SAM-dependent methyltransferase [Halobacteriaceae archaeon]